ncbi:MAG: hypothetical protein O3A36_02300 [bacterium]|nr:hypothetical protein [bacterium]
MKQLISLSSMAVAVFALVASAALPSSAHAATNVYSFIARGIVTDFDVNAGTAKIDITKVAGKGKLDLVGNNTEFIVKNASTVYKRVAGKDKRVTYRNLAIGQEVGIKGVKKDNDTYVVSFIRIEDRSFVAVGNLEAFNKNAHTMTVLMVSSTYKPTLYNKSKNVKVNMVFGDDYTTFYNHNGKVAISADAINADAQKVRLIGYVTDKNVWKVTKMWNLYKGK